MKIAIVKARSYRMEPFEPNQDDILDYIVWYSPGHTQEKCRFDKATVAMTFRHYRFCAILFKRFLSEEHFAQMIVTRSRV